MVRRAVLYTPVGPDWMQNLTDGFDHCHTVGHQVLGVVRGAWEVAAALVDQGAADLIVVAHLAHIPLGPDVEVAGEALPDGTDQ